MTEEGLSGPFPDENSGKVMLQAPDGITRMLAWTKTEDWDLGDAEFAIDLWLVAMIGEVGAVLESFTDKVTASISDLDVVYQHFEFTLEGATSSVVAGGWYCEPSSAAFSAFVTASPNADAVSYFQDFVSTFECL